MGQSKTANACQIFHSTHVFAEHTSDMCYHISSVLDLRRYRVQYVMQRTPLLATPVVTQLP